MAEKGLWNRIHQIDRRILFLFLIISIAAPLAFPLGLPITIRDQTVDAYNLVESIPDNGIVLMRLESTAGSWDEMNAAILAVTQHCLRRPLRLIFASWTYADTTTVLLQQGFPKLNFGDKEYGTDYVVIGYLMGSETSTAALMDDAHALVSTDYYGTPISQLPLMNDFKGGDDLAALVTIGAGDHEIPFRQITVPYDVPTLGGFMAVGTPRYISYYQAGIIHGVVDSITGGAEYESMINKPGAGLAGTDAISTSHILMIAFLIIGNIAYRLAGGQEKPGRGTAKMEAT
jgi:hypothetical protein